MMGVSSLILLLFLASIEATPPAEGEATPTTEATPSCPGLAPPPAKPFRVVWNHPDNCQHLLSRDALEGFRIDTNHGRRFLGETVLTLYNTGTWPRYRKGNPEHGGLPQLYNDTKFAALRSNLAKLNLPAFKGLGVLDWETWRPVFETNWGDMTVYRGKSYDLARSKKWYDWGTTVRLAGEEWNAAARRIMSGKLAAAKEEMPDGYWGYYLYPRTWGSAHYTASINDKMSWLWRESTGLYPSVYLYMNKNTPLKNKVRFVADTVAEAVRVQSKYSPPNTAIFPYASFIEMQSGGFMDKTSLQAIMWEQADRGASGSVLWGSSGLYRQPGICKTTKDYVTNTLGPLVKNVTEFMTQCSKDVCNGHGRCVHNAKDSLMTTEAAVQSSSSCTSRDSRFKDYHCLCYAQWQGDCCTEARQCQK